MTKLNKRQRTFAEAYAIPGTERHGNAYKSALYAGYSEKTALASGKRLLENAGISEHIRGIEQKIFDENIMSGKEVLYRLTRTARAEHTEIEVMITKTGEYKENPINGKMQLVYDENIQLVPRPPKVSDQNKALELLGKYHKLFTDKVVTESTERIQIVNDLDD